MSAIQETHIPNDHNYKFNGYRILTTKANTEHIATTGLPIGGVSILIHGDLEQHIVQIKRIDRRITQVTLHFPKSYMPLAIVCTYAPHQGSGQKEQKEHWGKHKKS